MMNDCTEMHEQDVDLSDRKNIIEYLIPKMNIFLSNLDDIWDDIGFTINDRKQKGVNIVENVKELFNDMLEEANELKNNLIRTNTTLHDELIAIGKELSINISIEVEEYDSMPLNTANIYLKEKITKYKDIYLNLYKEANELNAKEKILCRKLGKSEKYLSTSPLPTEEEISNFKMYLRNLSNEKAKREENFVKMKSEIIDMMKDIGVKPSLDFEKNIVNGNEFLVTDENMKLLIKWHSSLKDQQNDIHSKIFDLREKISLLWERLEESPKKRSDFTNKYSKNNISTYEALKLEESNCREKIKANYRTIVEKMRHEIIKWWDQCYFGEEEKKEFIHFQSDCYTEDLLILHERYIDKLKHHFETNKNIYDLISKRTELWERLQELEERAVRPDRLKNRGGQLLREEKERNSVKAHLPKVEQQLLNLVAEYEKKYNNPFVIYGQRVSEIIDNDWDQYKENRHNQISAKKQARENVKAMKSPRTVLASTALSNLNRPTTAPNTPRTPKRKIPIPLFNSASAKKNKATSKKIVPKIQVTATTINKRASLERRKRLEHKKRSSEKRSAIKSVNTTDYDNFELGLENKEACRSTLGNEKLLDNNNAGPSTSFLVRTPSRSNLRAKSPSNIGNRLTPKNMPIIF